MKARLKGPDYHNRTLIHIPPHDHKILVFSYEKKKEILKPFYGCPKRHLLTDFRLYRAIFDN